MGNTDFAGIQQDWLRRMSRSSALYSDAWAGAFSDGSFERFCETYRRLVQGRADREPRGGADLFSALSGFLDLAGSAAEDLPDLLRQSQEASARRRIVDRWTKSCERFLRESLGLPSRTETNQMERAWNRLTQIPPYSARAGYGWAPWESAGWWEMIPDSALPPLAREWRKFWDEACRKTLESFSQLGMRPGQEARLSMGRQELIDAQAKSLESMSVLNDMVSKASTELADRLVSSVLSQEIGDLSLESYISFVKVWLTQWEETIRRLVDSEAFLKLLEETWWFGTDFRKIREIWASEWRNLLDAPGKDEVENAVRSVELMQARIASLENEVRALKAKVEELTNSA